MLVIIDNYDSFTYNLVQYFGELGEDPTVILNDQMQVGEIEDLHPTRIVVSPGPCTPKEAGISNDVIRAFSGRLPILGVCLGHQCIGAVFGGRIIQAPRLMHGKISLIHHNSMDIFKDISSPFEATRYHSLVVDPEHVPDCIEVTAQTDQQEIMALQISNPVYL